MPHRKRKTWDDYSDEATPEQRKLLDQLQKLRPDMNVLKIYGGNFI